MPYTGKTILDDEEFGELLAAYEYSHGSFYVGALHIVMEDANLDDESVQVALCDAIRSGDYRGAAIMANLLLHPDHFRQQAINNADSTRKS